MQNLFIGKGNLAKPPTLERNISRKTGEEFIVAKMRVMFSRYGQNTHGDFEQVGGFWREVEIYGNKAEACARFLKTGARVLVVGEERDFMAKNEAGDEVQVIKIVAEDVALQLSRIESIQFTPSRGQQQTQNQGGDQGIDQGYYQNQPQEYDDIPM
ncbi:single-stranded DNA-binding protein [Acidovorax sp. SUPP3334]|uniref:single-stranded DNA-binding protein n=1 Tax=Acidovorax sp. SUPP3334 TaxID=2920881 RepID=UPI0023DE62BD|nr:single-stranded DNA-binding protein [Acidovorax sp. SUPP3334]GKT25145.1 single-stranded DNA-binding protein [Acidovorax sp. SUPP3334]